MRPETVLLPLLVIGIHSQLAFAGVVQRQDNPSSTGGDSSTTSGNSDSATVSSASTTSSSASTTSSLASTTSSSASSTDSESATTTSQSASSSSTRSESPSSSSQSRTSSSTSASASATETSSSSSSRQFGGLGLGGLIGVAIGGAVFLFLLYMLLCSLRRRKREKRKRPRTSLYAGSEFFARANDGSQSSKPLMSSAKAPGVSSTSSLGRAEFHHRDESADTPLLPLNLRAGGDRNSARDSWAYNDSRMSFQVPEGVVASLSKSRRTAFNDGQDAEREPMMPERSGSPVYFLDRTVHPRVSSPATVTSPPLAGQDEDTHTQATALPAESEESAFSTKTLPMPFPESDEGHRK